MPSDFPLDRTREVVEEFGPDLLPHAKTLVVEIAEKYRVQGITVKLITAVGGILIVPLKKSIRPTLIRDDRSIRVTEGIVE